MKSPPHDLFQRLAGLFGLVSIILIAAFQTGFFAREYRISHDTWTYSNLPGLSEGFSLRNFSSELRPPGMGLFFAAVTLGKLPRRDAISFVICGDSVFANEPSCDQAVAPN